MESFPLEMRLRNEGTTSGWWKLYCRARALQDCVFMQFTPSLHTVLFVALWRRLTRIVAGAVAKRQEEGDHIEQTIRWLHWPGEL